MWFLNKNSLMLQNYQSFTETVVMDTENILWKFELDRIIILDFTVIGSLRYKKIRVSGAKLFLSSIFTKFLNVCPFDYTAFAVSGKVGIP